MLLRAVNGFYLRNELCMLPWLLLMAFATGRPSHINIVKHDSLRLILLNNVRRQGNVDAHAYDSYWQSNFLKKLQTVNCRCSTLQKSLLFIKIIAHFYALNNTPTTIKSQKEIEYSSLNYR